MKRLALIWMVSFAALLLLAGVGKVMVVLFDWLYDQHFNGYVLAVIWCGVVATILTVVFRKGQT